MSHDYCPLCGAHVRIVLGTILIHFLPGASKPCHATNRPLKEVQEEANTKHNTWNILANRSKNER